MCIDTWEYEGGSLSGSDKTLTTAPDDDTIEPEDVPDVYIYSGNSLSGEAGGSQGSQGS